MNKFSSADHPIGFVQLIADKFGDDVMLSFSRYMYRPQSVFDERECFEIPAGDVTEQWLEREVNALNPQWEIALNSRFTDAKGRTRHIGMIDFTGRPELGIVSEKIRNLLGADMLSKIWYYDSGRSLHGYLADFMGPKEWHQFLGRLLLMNAPESPAIVDARWIGHRLLGGYAALRWSANSLQHKMVPCRVKSHL